ncbi:hypothetical protein HY638_01680 [Candidatus Woesearchaeota archaeon]|nr:hypothetical protein [Candidatus Woesearchaeota archaeon]
MAGQKNFINPSLLSPAVRMNQKEYVDTIRSKYRFDALVEFLHRLEDLNVLVIGDAIIDHYIFATPKGRATKDPILSAKFDFEEWSAGGVLAVANHISTFVKKVTVITLLGDTNPMTEFVKSSLLPNVELKFFVKENSPTIIKRRFIETYRNHKMFKVEYMNDAPITDAKTEEIKAELEACLPSFDLVVVSDFGHGFINESLRRKIEEKSRYLAVNSQTNSANMGYNYITLYKRADFISLDEQEVRIPLSRRFEDIEAVSMEFHEKFGINPFLITRGKYGSMFFRDKGIYAAPVLTNSVKDTVGAGDAAFAIGSLLAYSNAPGDIVPFFANCAGGISSNIMGNKEYVTKEALTKFIGGIYNGMG